MSILLIGLDGNLGTALSRRLIQQNDEVRVLITDEDDLGGVPDAGVHVATGRYLQDADLIERACQNVRTLVIGDLTPIRSAVREIVEGARLAGVTRIVAVSRRTDETIRSALLGSGLEYAIVRTGTKGIARRSAVPVDHLAEAIDAADDLAGDVKLDLDLTDPRAWESLKLPVPDAVAG